MTKRPQDTSAEEPDGGNPHIRFRGGPERGNRLGLLNTARLFVLYPPPKNAQEFDRAYLEEHLPMAGPKLKGATRVVTLRVVGPASAPPPYYLISEITFPDVGTL